MNQELITQELINEEGTRFIGNLFSLAGSVLFLIGTFIATVVTYHAYNRLRTQGQGGLT
ncbi:hypothetical protein ACFVR1_03640 [Psychrobacillus sp. NPDC058041]|uniref:hypothetical protein n=1 Tax=Psychrobacillus sp. NPDC058041 TaxID=3346310 RepID=UPI0036DB2A97